MVRSGLETSKVVRMSREAMDTNCMTLTRFILAEQKKYAPTGTGNFHFSSISLLFDVYGVKQTFEEARKWENVG